MSDRLIALRYKAARLARFLRLRRLAAAIAPPITPWYLRRPMGYIEHFAGHREQVPDTAPEPIFEDVMLTQARWMDKAKRAKLIEVAFTEPDPKKAGEAAAELRHMIFNGGRA